MQRSKSSERAFLKPRLSSLLNQRLDQKLLGYAAAAGAAAAEEPPAAPEEGSVDAADDYSVDPAHHLPAAPESPPAVAA